MVNAIVFTMNRAMQLDAFLRSMEKWAPSLFPITVMYRATSGKFLRGYSVLQGEHSSVQWVDQSDFKIKLIGLVNQGRPLTAMFVDDDLFYRSFTEPPSVASGECWSIRLEEISGYQRTPSRHPLGGYSVDGNIHRTEDLRAALESVDFADPCRLEEALNWNPTAPPVVERHGHLRCLVNVPNNHVANVFPDIPFMGGLAKELNDRYLAGERIDLDTMDFGGIGDCHCPVEYKFKR